MGFNVSASMGYQLENSEFLRSAAKNILNSVKILLKLHRELLKKLCSIRMFN